MSYFKINGDDIFEPVRGGTRGGKDQFKWSDVKKDQYRENYLGHSIKVPIGHQQYVDFYWYNKKEEETKDKNTLKTEIDSIKETEAAAMAAALGQSYSYLTKNPNTMDTNNRMVFTPAVNEKTPKTKKKNDKSVEKERTKDRKRKSRHSIDNYSSPLKERKLKKSNKNTCRESKNDIYNNHDLIDKNSNYKSKKEYDPKYKNSKYRNDEFFLKDLKNEHSSSKLNDSLRSNKNDVNYKKSKRSNSKEIKKDNYDKNSNRRSKFTDDDTDHNNRRSSTYRSTDKTR